MQAAVQQVADAWGRIDIVVANAGINGVWAPVEDITPEEWDQTLDINLKGTFLTVKYALPWLKKAGGSIVVVSSVNGTRMFSNSGASAYASSKAAQVAFTKMTALELAPHKVRVNCICPGGITTEIRDNTYMRNMDNIGYPVEFPAGKIPLTHGQSGTIEQVRQADLVPGLARVRPHHRHRNVDRRRTVSVAGIDDSCGKLRSRRSMDVTAHEYPRRVRRTATKTSAGIWTHKEITRHVT